MTPDQIFDDAYELMLKSNVIIEKTWFTDIVFSWRWWLCVVLSILPWLIWIKIRDKKNTVRLLFVGLIAMLISVTLDNIGINLGFWHYDWTLSPFLVTFLPFDYSLFPVGIMLILQFKPKINVFIKAIAFALFCTFIFEPFFVWIKMYDLTNWEHWYSFFIYIPLYLFFNYIYKRKLFI